MKIFSISDLHLSLSVDKPMDVFGGNWEGYVDEIVRNWNEMVQDDDLVLIAGDISWAMRIDQAKQDLLFLDSLKGKKVIIKGNHDYWWNSLAKVKTILPGSVFALQNNAVRFEDGFVIAGTRGWNITPNDGAIEDLKIYKRELIRLQLSLDEANKIKKEGDKVICMMHFPPFNAFASDSEYTQILEKNRVDAVVYGHLHGGLVKYPKFIEKSGIKYYLTSCDQIANKPVIIYE